jgi:hypothetical protein
MFHPWLLSLEIIKTKNSNYRPLDLLKINSEPRTHKGVANHPSKQDMVSRPCNSYPTTHQNFEQKEKFYVVKSAIIDGRVLKKADRKGRTIY